MAQTTFLDARHAAELAITDMEWKCPTYESRVDWLLSFEDAIRRDEREACALACKNSGSVNWAWVDAETLCAERIRKRSNVGVQRRPAHDGRDPQDGLGPSAATTGSASGSEAKGN